MTPYDVSPDDEPLDVAAVGSDDALIESLRRSLSPEAAVVWDDDEDDLDPAFALLRNLQRDVAADLPAAAALLPAGVTALVPRQRRFGRTATIAAVTAGVLSIGGVAAAAGGNGSPLAGVRSAVSSVVKAITLDHPVGPAVAHPRHSSTPSPKASTSGDAVSDAARSAAATSQISALLDKASRFLDAGQYSAAGEQLDAAARKLPLVLDGTTRDGFATRITALRARLASPRPDATAGDGNGQDGRGKDGADTKSGTDSKDNADTKGSTDGSDKSGKTAKPGDDATSGRGDSGSTAKPSDHATDSPEQGGRSEPSRAPHVGKSEAPAVDTTDHAPRVDENVDGSGNTRSQG